MTINQRFLRLDSRVTEICTGAFFALCGLWLIPGHWLVALFPDATGMQGLEPLVAVPLFVYGISHAYVGASEAYGRRAINAMVALFIFIFCCIQIGSTHGWGSPAMPALLLAAVVQAWVYLHDTRMARCWIA